MTLFIYVTERKTNKEASLVLRGSEEEQEEAWACQPNRASEHPPAPRAGPPPRAAPAQHSHATPHGGRRRRRRRKDTCIPNIPRQRSRANMQMSAQRIL